MPVTVQAEHIPLKLAQHNLTIADFTGYISKALAAASGFRVVNFIEREILDMKLPNSRLVNGLGLLVCVASLLFAIFYLERTLYLDPCPLCIIDRIILTSMGVIFLVAMLHNPSRLGQRIYGIVNLIVAASGISVAARHVWLQHLPADKVPECGAGLAYMLENFPLHETLKMVLQGSGECAEIQWEFLGLSIPEQTLILFVALSSIILAQILRRSD